MFKKLLNLENNFTVTKAALIIGFFTLLSKLVGLVRDPLLASRIGVGDTLDVYYAAFRIPDLIFNLLILGTLSVALIPVFTEWLIKDKAKAYRLANSVLNISLLGMTFICLLLLVLSTPLAKILVPGFTGEKLQRTIQLMRLFLLSPLIFTASNIFTSILSSYKKFLVLSLAPILYNIGIIAGLFFLYPRFGLMGLGVGVIFGAFMHLLIQIPEAVRYGYRWQAVIDWHEPVLKKIAKLFLPRIIGMDISQISLIIGTTVGSILAAGSVTIFNLANNLQAAPLGVFALSVSAASFPLLSEHFAKKDEQSFVKTLAHNTTLVLFFIIPIAILMIIFRAYVVRIIYGHGKFSWNDTILMFTTFGILTFSLIGQSLSPLFSRSFYARQNTIVPVIVNFCSIILDIILAYTLGKRFGLIGIASGFAIACTFDALAMFCSLRWQLHKENVSMAEFDSRVIKFLAQILACSIPMGFVGYGMIYALAPFVDTHTTIGIIAQSGGAVLTALIVFFLLSYSFGMEQSLNIVEFIKGKIGKTNQVVSSELQ
jgi:putative peptidoglycan lipid II flippase